VKQSADGQWQTTFISLLGKAAAEPTAERPAEIDVGLETFATFDDGRKVAPPRFYR
jgi:hypothetical protein